MANISAYLYCGAGVSSISWEWRYSPTGPAVLKGTVTSTTAPGTKIVENIFTSGKIYFTNIVLKSGYDISTLTWVYNTTGGSGSYQYGSNWSSCTMDAAGYTRYGHWQASPTTTTHTATIRYNANGGIGGTVDKTFSSTGTQIDCYIVSAASLGFSRTGYTFQGWAIERLGSVVYNAGEGVRLGAGDTLILYAVWKEDVTYTYTITYYKNDGSSTSASYYTTSGASTSQTFTVIECPWTYTGYTFSVWAGSPTLTSPIYLIGNTYSTSSNMSIYAHWNPNSYTIYFNGNGSTSGNMSSMSCYYGSSYNLNRNTYQRAYSLTYNQNYTGGTTSSTTVYCNFLHWSCSNGSIYQDGASVSNLTSTNNGRVTMYAQWEYGSVSLPTPTRSGYTFEGWYTSTGTFVGVGGSAYTVKSDQTLYAHWTQSTIKPSLSYASHTDTTITVSLNRNNATTGSWIIEASLSNFGTVVYTATITSTTQTTITLTGLTPETTYYIRARHVKGGVSTSSDVISATTRTSTFQWTSNDSVYVIKSAVFTDAITAAKWNELIKKVNWCRDKKGLSTASLNSATSGQPILATNFTAMRNAIADMHTVTPARSAGDEILAAYFANSDTSLKSAINAVITTL